MNRWHWSLAGRGACHYDGVEIALVRNILFVIVCLDRKGRYALVS